MTVRFDDNDKQIYGCTDPRWTGSFSTNVYFKGFDFSIMFYTKSGFWSRSYFHEKYMKYSDRGNAHMQLDYYIPKESTISSIMQQVRLQPPQRPTTESILIQTTVIHPLVVTSATRVQPREKASSIRRPLSPRLRTSPWVTPCQRT